MTTIKTPQTVSRNKNNKGFVTILLLITWVVIAIGYYGIKTGMLQPDNASSAVDAKIAAVESKTTALENRVSALEKKLSDVGAALTPVVPGAPADATKPAEGAAAPAESKDATKPMDTAPADAKKPEAGAATAPAAPVAPATPPAPAAPKAEEKKDAEPATKPQTNNNSGKDDRASAEKKSSRLMAKNTVSAQ